MLCRLAKERRVSSWSPPLPGVLKFIVDGPDGVVRGKLGPAGIGGVLQNSRGDELVVSSKFLDVKDSNGVEVLAILGALKIFSGSFKGQLVVESDSLNAIIGVSSPVLKPWKFQVSFTKIKFLFSQLQVEFHHVVLSANTWLML